MSNKGWIGVEENTGRLLNDPQRESTGKVEGYYELDSAPRDGTMTWVLVDYSSEESHHPLADASMVWTIGFNNLDNDGEDTWRFAGWSWDQDVFTQGLGKVVGWKPTGFELEVK